MKSHPAISEIEAVQTLLLEAMARLDTPGYNDRPSIAELIDVAHGRLTSALTHLETDTRI